MNSLNSLSNGFFNTIQYDDEFKGDNWQSKMERAADVCRAPSRWFAAELWSGGKVYTITAVSDENGFKSDAIECKASQGMQKVMRIVLGLFLSLPGQILALPLMSLAYTNEEIRLKHKLTVRLLTDEESKKLEELVQNRQELAKERQGCEPISCLLLSICCLLCCLVCRK